MTKPKQTLNRIRLNGVDLDRSVSVKRQDLTLKLTSTLKLWGRMEAG